MSEHNTSTSAQRQYPHKPCLVCGKPITGIKLCMLKKQKTCSAECRTAYQTGRQNPNWRGGMVEVSCKQCGRKCNVIPAKAKTNRFCNRVCLGAWNAARWKGENSPRWKGGQQVAKRRYHGQSGLLPFPRPRILCVVCGLPGTKKRRYHRECKPVPKSVIVNHTCPDCGKVRVIRVAPNRMPKHCRACSEKYRSGPNNANWKGGITPENKQARASAAYAEWRTSVFTRDKYTCVWCGQRGGKLHADHIKPFSTHHHLRFDVNNGRTLCVACHKKTPTYLAGALKHAK